MLLPNNFIFPITDPQATKIIGVVNLMKHECLVIEYPRKLLPFSQAHLDELKNLVKNANQAYPAFLNN
jgi:hypothetical protein